MSISRQPRPRLRSYSITHPPGRVTLPTQPGWDHVVFAHSGLFTALSDSRAWTVPAHRALCVPDGTGLQIETPRRSAIRCLYLDAALGIVGSGMRVVSLGPLARELVAFAIDVAPSPLRTPRDEALVALLADQLAIEPPAPLHLPLPIDPIARDLATAVLADPGTGLDDQVRSVGASRRTLERRFREETGMTLGQWRRRARVLRGVELLAEGRAVTSVALRVGYSSSSAFIAAFRAELDVPPGEFLRRSG